MEEESILIKMVVGPVKEIKIPFGLGHPEICDLIDNMVGKGNWTNYMTEI